MGLAEEHQRLQGAAFIGSYVILAAVPIILVLRNNKTYLGRYF
jgi:hypothetical protein